MSGITDIDSATVLQVWSFTDDQVTRFVRDWHYLAIELHSTGKTGEDVRLRVQLISSTPVIMYGFTPITLMALRRTEPDRACPYRLPVSSILAPLAFIAANEIIYWTPWTTVQKLMLAILASYAIFGISSVLGCPIERPPLHPRSLVWILPWLTSVE